MDAAQLVKITSDLRFYTKCRVFTFEFGAPLSPRSQGKKHRPLGTTDKQRLETALNQNCSRENQKRDISANKLDSTK